MADDVHDSGNAHLQFSAASAASPFDPCSSFSGTETTDTFFSLNSTQRISFGGALRQHRQQQDNFDILQSRMSAASLENMHA
jgi:hypothetical protein